MAKDPKQLKKEGEELKALFAKIKKKPHNCAILIAKDGIIFEAHLKKSPEILVKMAKKKGGSAKGAWGTITMEGQVLVLTPVNEKVPGNLPKLAKTYFSARGLKNRLEIPEPVDADPKPASDPKQQDDDNDSARLKAALEKLTPRAQKILAAMKELKSGPGGDAKRLDLMMGNISGSIDNVRKHIRAGALKDAANWLDGVKKNLVICQEEIDTLTKINALFTEFSKLKPVIDSMLEGDAYEDSGVLKSAVEQFKGAAKRADLKNAESWFGKIRDIVAKNQKQVRQDQAQAAKLNNRFNRISPSVDLILKEKNSKDAKDLALALQEYHAALKGLDWPNAKGWLETMEKIVNDHNRPKSGDDLSALKGKFGKLRPRVKQILARISAMQENKYADKALLKAWENNLSGMLDKIAKALDEGKAKEAAEWISGLINNTAFYEKEIEKQRLESARKEAQLRSAEGQMEKLASRAQKILPALQKLKNKPGVSAQQLEGWAGNISGSLRQIKEHIKAGELKDATDWLEALKANLDFYESEIPKLEKMTPQIAAMAKVKTAFEFQEQEFKDVAADGDATTESRAMNRALARFKKAVERNDADLAEQLLRECKEILESDEKQRAKYDKLDKILKALMPKIDAVLDGPHEEEGKAMERAINRINRALERREFDLAEELLTEIRAILDSAAKKSAKGQASSGGDPKQKAQMQRWFERNKRDINMVLKDKKSKHNKAMVKWVSAYGKLLKANRVKDAQQALDQVALVLKAYAKDFKVSAKQKAAIFDEMKVLQRQIDKLMTP